MSDKPAGFEQKGLNAPNEMDELAAKFYEKGSVPAHPDATEAVPPLAVREAAAAAAEEQEEVQEGTPEEIAAAEETEDLEAIAETEDEETVSVEELEETDEETDEEKPEVEMVDMGDGTQVPLEELVAGSLRQADYTKKTQELAESRRTFEAEKQSYIEKQASVGQYITQLATQLEAQIGQQADPAELEALRTSDPAEYSARMIDLQKKQELAHAARSQQEALYNQQRFEVVQRERAALAEKHEGFKKDFDGTYAEITQWVTDPDGGGLPPEMWDQIFDHRAVLLVEKAMKHDRTAKVKVPKVTRTLAKLPKVVRPGRKVASNRQTETVEYADALSRAKETGSVNDLAAAFAMKERMKRDARKK